MNGSNLQYETALGGLAVEIFRQSNGAVAHDVAYTLAASYLDVRTIPASRESNEDAAREIWWQYQTEGTLDYSYPDPETRRQQWYRDWHTNTKSRNIFRIIQKHTATVFKKDNSYKFVLNTPDGQSYFSEGHADRAAACKHAHIALLGLLQEVHI